MAAESILTDAGGALISATEGKYILALLTFLVILFSIVVLVVVKLIYEMPKQWERATDAILSRIDKMVDKLDYVVQKTDLNCQIFTQHDKQAAEIKNQTVQIPHIKDTCDETKSSVGKIEKCLIEMKAEGKSINGGRG